MVKRRTDRRFLPAAGFCVARVRFPVCSAQRTLPPPHQVSETGNSDGRPCSSSTSTSAAEKTGSHVQICPGGPGPAGDTGQSESKRARPDSNEEAAAPTSRDGVPGSCDPAGGVPGPDQQGAAENSRAAELQSVGSLKVTIQQRSQSREFGQTDRTSERQTGQLHCHVCNLTCRSAQVFQEHMTGQKHLRKLQEITHCIHLNTHTSLDRGRRSETQRWCDSCQIHFSGDVIQHRRTKQHKVCKQLCRPFCPVCKRHFRTPRKFVEHMKSAEHKHEVHLQDAQEEELITLDAVGCFQEEEDEEEEGAEAADEEDEGVEEPKGAESKTNMEEEGEDDDGSDFVVPVSGFLCRLCSKFFYREDAARHTHCRTHTHRLNLQRHRAERRRKEKDPDQERPGSDQTRIQTQT